MRHGAFVPTAQVDMQKGERWGMPNGGRQEEKNGDDVGGKAEAAGFGP